MCKLLLYREVEEMRDRLGGGSDVLDGYLFNLIGR